MLPMMKQRTPAVANAIVGRVAAGGGTSGPRAQGFSWRPSWRALFDGQRPSKPSSEPGEWPHGWQYWPPSVSDPHLRSHSGWNASTTLAHAPTARAYNTATTLVPRVALGTVATPTSCDRGAVRRLSCFSGRQWAPPSGVLLDREVGEEDTHGAHLGPDVPRSRSEGRTQRDPSGHERGGPCGRWETCRGFGSRPPGRCPIACGHHIAELSDLAKPPTPGSRRGRSSVDGSQARERNDVPGTCCFGPMQTRRGRH